MKRLSHEVALWATVAGLATGVTAHSVDVINCDGKVKSIGSEVSVVFCDEDPSSNNLINNPRTLAQKIEYSSFVVTGVGGVMLLGSRRRFEPQTEIAN